MTNRTYRYFTGEPLWGFGYGLSYSDFKWSNVKLSAANLKAGEPLTVDADVKNTSAMKGEAVSEIYLKAPASAGAPRHALVGFVRTPLNGMQQQHIHVVIDPRSLSTVSADGNRSVEPGEYTVFVGGAQPGKDSSGASQGFTITGRKKLPR